LRRRRSSRAAQEGDADLSAGRDSGHRAVAQARAAAAFRLGQGGEPRRYRRPRRGRRHQRANGQGDLRPLPRGGALTHGLRHGSGWSVTGATRGHERLLEPAQPPYLWPHHRHPGARGLLLRHRRLGGRARHVDLYCRRRQRFPRRLSGPRLAATKRYRPHARSDRRQAHRGGGAAYARRRSDHRRLVAVGRRDHPLPRDPGVRLARISRIACRRRSGDAPRQVEDGGADGGDRLSACRQRRRQDLALHHAVRPDALVDRRLAHALYRLRLSPRRATPRHRRGGVMSTRLLYFAWVKEKTGVAAEEVDIPAHVTTVAELMTWLKTRGPEFDHAFARSEVIRAAIDKAHVRHDAAIGAAREIAFFPPVTGG